ncbi:hypothetical protein J7K05_02055 [bacterium]|nr:hypothetical protein [bacterium]
MKIKIVRLVEITLVAIVIIGGLVLGIWYLRNRNYSQITTKQAEETSAQDEIVADVKGVEEEIDELDSIENELLGEDLEEIENALSEENLSAIE